MSAPASPTSARRYRAECYDVNHYFLRSCVWPHVIQTFMGASARTDAEKRAADLNAMLDNPLASPFLRAFEEMNGRDFSPEFLAAYKSLAKRWQELAPVPASTSAVASEMAEFRVLDAAMTEVADRLFRAIPRRLLPAAN